MVYAVKYFDDIRMISEKVMYVLEAISLLTGIPFPKQCRLGCCTFGMGWAVLVFYNSSVGGPLLSGISDKVKFSSLDSHKYVPPKR